MNIWIIHEKYYWKQFMPFTCAFLLLLYDFTLLLNPVRIPMGLYPLHAFALFCSYGPELDCKTLLL